MIHEIIEKNDFFHCYQHLYKLECMSTIGAELLLRTEMGNPEFIFQMVRLRRDPASLKMANGRR